MYEQGVSPKLYGIREGGMNNSLLFMQQELSPRTVRKGNSLLMSESVIWIDTSKTYSEFYFRIAHLPL